MGKVSRVSKVMVTLLITVLITTAYAVHLPNEAAYVTWNTDVKVTHAAEFSSAAAQRQDDVIRDAYNAIAFPAFWVWKTSVTKKEIYEGVLSDSTTWSWTIFMNQTVQQQNAYYEQFATTGTWNASLPQNRAGMSSIFGASNAQTTYLLGIAKRQATRLEQLLADTSGGGVGTFANPAKLVYEGFVTTNDVAHMLVPSTVLN